MFARRCIATLIVATILAGQAYAQDALVDGFREPPPEARPRIWWHWMNGNITEQGIAKDLAWMKRIGIGGVQTFDANLLTPQVVTKPIVYMTPEWKKAFRFATRTAADLNLELGIAASPGWSETGGPWVSPQDGVKKLVWSETAIMGGNSWAGKLPAPPSISGPFQNMAAEGDQLAALSGERQFEPPSNYGDIAVLAYPLPNSAALPLPRAILANDKHLDIGKLSDANLTTSIDIPRGSAAKPTTLSVSYNEPQTIRSVTFHAGGGAEKFGAPFFLPTLEASDDGKLWRKLADLALTPLPTTVSFAPVTATHFRIVMLLNPTGGLSGFAPAAGIDFAFLAPLVAPKPLTVSEFRLSNEAKVHQFEAKAGFATVLGYAPLNTVSLNEERAPAPNEVVNLTDRLKSDGTLDWTPPKGRWRVVRLGWSLTGKSNHPAPFEATGLEVDKLDGQAVRKYLQHYIGMYKDAVGVGLIGKTGIGALLTDSTEVGAFNWTPRMIEQFKRLRGYDPTPWLPTLTGSLIGSRVQSDAFLYDYRRTISELHATEHYGTVAAVARANGLKVYGEALEDRRPSLGDDMAMRQYADFPMAALWTYPRGGAPRPTLLGDMRGAASVAHIYGQNIAAAESMTSALQYWSHAPADLRRVIDLEFANGINRPVIHSSVHQPLDDKQPGLSLLIFGQYFNRHETWGEMAKPWIDYMARNSFMLQQGRNHADVAYFYGEDAPLTAQFAEAPISDVPTAYAYDFVNADVLQNILSVDGGDLSAPSGARYRVLFLGAASRSMTLPILRRIAKLASEGATIVGQAPAGSPSLSDDKSEYAKLIGQLWSGEPITAVGKGRVIAGLDVEAALKRVGVVPDFAYTKPASDSEVLFVHRKLADGDAYFINNRQNRSETIEARFGVSGKVPELWRADTGQILPISYRIENGVTIVPLDMAAEDSFFVMFRKTATASSMTVEKTDSAPVILLDGVWNVAFQPGRGATASLKLDKLASLSEQTDPGVKYFSGTATYTKNFDLPRNIKRNHPLLLDLGQVGDVAEVRVNGQAVGTAWKAPFQIDIGKAVRRGDNIIEVKVANLWVNRLIGDAQQGAAKVTFTTLPTYSAGAPLRPSGLIGPVTLLGAIDKDR